MPGPIRWAHDDGHTLTAARACGWSSLDAQALSGAVTRRPPHRLFVPNTPSSSTAFASGEPLKAISLWQPWASLIVAGLKTTETRGWTTKHRGPLIIHAAKRPIDAFGRALCERYASVLGEDALPLGAVVGICQLIDVLQVDPTFGLVDEVEAGIIQVPLYQSSKPGWSFRGDGCAVVGHEQADVGDLSHGRYAWLLDDIVALDEPIEQSGRQGLWTWTR